MASKTQCSLSNNVVALLQQYIPLSAEEKEEQKEAFQALANEVIALVDKERAKAAPIAAAPAKKFVFKAPGAAAKPVAEAGMTKTGKVLTNYQRFVQAFAQAWKDTKGESELSSRKVTPIKDRPPGTSKSVGLRQTLVDGAEDILWDDDQSFGSLVAVIRKYAPDRLMANGVCWLVLDDKSREAVCML